MKISKKDIEDIKEIERSIRNIRESINKRKETLLKEVDECKAGDNAFVEFGEKIIQSLEQKIKDLKSD